MSKMMDNAHSHYLPGVPFEIPPVNYTVPDTIEKAARDFPLNVAIDFLGREYTYQQVLREIQRAITALTLVGVRRGDVVSIILPNCPQHYIAFYAIQFLGAVASEHNPLAPREQLVEQLARVGSRVVIAWEKTIETLAAGGVLMGYTYLKVDLTKALPKRSQRLLKLPLKSARAQREKLRGNVPPGVHSWDNQVAHAMPMNLQSVPRPDLDDVAVLIQTGGTTGTPKAVELTHRNIVSNAEQVYAWLNFERGNQTVAAVLPFFHAFGLQLSLSVCVGLGATQVMLPSFDVDMLLAAHKRHPITFFGGVAPMFQRILKAVESGKKADLTSIKYGISGAMALDPQLAKAWEKATGGILIEGYGMTEASPVIAGSPISSDRRPSTLGVVLPSTEAKVVDPEDPTRECGEGEVGELMVRGPQVFRGYFKNPEETALAITEDGFLRTGDLVRWDDGFLVMADRRKELIINGGFNIYPSEVEAALRDMPGVIDVAVVGMPTESVGESVVAAFVLEPGAALDIESIREWAERKISHYALPKSFAVVNDLPRSQIGKVLRKGVRERLSTWELSSGQWHERIADATAQAAGKVEELRDRAEAFIDKADEIKDILAETRRDLHAKVASALEETEPVDETVGPDPDSHDDEANKTEKE